MCESSGGPEVMVLKEIADPVPKADEVVIEVVTAGVNRADILQRQGYYPPPPGESEILGLEVAGVVVAIGDKVRSRAVGDKVCALLAGGGYAQQVAVPASLTLPVPANVPLPSAAALPEALATVYYNLVELAAIVRGDRILIHGGGSGIGTAAIQIAKAYGAKVACTAGSKAKLQVAESLGADLLINYHDQDFVTELKAVGGADVILDIIGAKYLPRNIDALKSHGRLLVIGLQGGRKGEIDLARLLMKQGAVYASSLRALPLARKARLIAAVERDLWPLVEQGKYQPLIDRVLPITQVADAHGLLEGGEITGKVLLSFD
ncbi:MAG: NAD(P)H-quinone oxidoreductase [Gammaproteobacteria bacterium]|nr:NAD(P)H-quinone oxidoreductase [Gammaproteobacteria bacterium]